MRGDGTDTNEGQGVRGEKAADLCQVAAELYGRGLCLGTSGNFSVTLTAEPLQLLITPSGVDKGRLDPASLLRVGRDGLPLPGESGTPSAEAILHATVAMHAGAGSVLHVHSVWNTLLGERFLPQGGFVLTGYEMLKGLSGVRSHEERLPIPVLENTQDLPALAEEVARMLETKPQTRGFLIAGHGLYTWGRTLEEAKRHVEIFEFLFECVGRRTDFSPFEG